MRENAGANYLAKKDREYRTTIRHRLPKILRKSQILTLLRKSKDPRLCMIIFMAIFQGLRVGEMTYHKYKGCSTPPLKWESVCLKAGEVTVLDGKNPHRAKNGGYGKDRIVPIFKQFIPVFRMWRAMNPDAEYVITNPLDTREPMLKRTTQDRYMTLLGNCGLLIADRYGKDGNARHLYNFHSLRHNCGTNLKRLGMPLEFIKDFLGHSNIQTTMIYIDLVRDDIRVELNKGCKKALELNGYVKTPKITMEIDRESLLLQREILEKQLELARMQQFAGGKTHELLPQQEI